MRDGSKDGSRDDGRDGRKGGRGGGRDSNTFTNTSIHSYDNCQNYRRIPFSVGLDLVSATKARDNSNVYLEVKLSEI